MGNKHRQVKNSFTAGLLSPRLAARSDFQKWSQGLKRCDNFLVMPHGGFTMRPGFEARSEAYTNNASVLVPFVYSTDQAYVLEFYAGAVGAVGVFYEGVKVLDVVVVPLTPYTASELPELRFTQSADTLFITHPDHPPAILQRYGHTDWRYSVLEIQGGPYEPATSSPGISIDPSADTGTGITLATTDAVTNGAFAAGIANWTDESTGAGSIAHDAVNSRMDLATGGAGVGWAEQELTVVDGVQYELALDVFDENIEIYIGTATNDNDLLHAWVNADEADHAKFFFTASGTSAFLGLRCSTGTGQVDNVVVKPAVFTMATGDDVVTGGQFDADMTGWTDVSAGSGEAYTAPTGGGDYTLALVGAVGDYAAAEQELTVEAETRYRLRCSLYSAYVYINTQTAAGGFGTDWIYFLQGLLAASSSTIDLDIEIWVPAGVTTIFLQFVTPAEGFGLVDNVRLTKMETDDGGDDGRLLFSDTLATGAGTSGQVRITSVDSPVEATADVVDALNGHAAQTDWQWGLWSYGNGWPHLCCFYEDRLIMAATDSYVNRIWGSVTGDYYDFSPDEDYDGTITDSDAVDFTLLSRQVHPIKWLEPRDSLIIGTSGGEWKMSGATNSEPLTPTSIRARQEGYRGGSAVDAARVGNDVIFVQRLGKQLFSLAYSLERDGNVSSDLAILAEHLFRDYAIEAVAWQQYPYAVLWVLRADGVLLGLTYLPEHDVVAWHKHDLGANTDGATIESMCVIPDDSGDRLYAKVVRTIGGSTQAFIERLAGEFVSEDSDAARFLDSWIASDNWNTTTDDYLKVTGTTYTDGDTVTLQATGHTPFSAGSVGDYYRLREASDHDSHVDVLITAYTDTDTVTGTLIGDCPTGLQDTNTAEWAALVETLSTQLTNGGDYSGETLHVVVDGAYAGTADVDEVSGDITLPYPAAVVVVGYAYTATAATFGLTGADTIGYLHRLHRLGFFLDRSIGGRYGVDEDDLVDIPMTQLDVGAMDQPPPLYTGQDYVEVAYADYTQPTSYVTIQQNLPYPMAVLALLLEVEVNT